MGRLCSLAGVEVDVVETVGMMMEVVEMTPNSDAVRESVIHCFGDLASGPHGVAAAAAISEAKCVALVLEAAKDQSANVFGDGSSSASLMVRMKNGAGG